jgi:hypothetical protein
VARSLLWAGWQRQALSTLHLRWASSSTSQPIPSFSFTSENHFTFKNSQKIQACSKFSKVLFHLLVQSLSPLALFFFFCDFIGSYWWPFSAFSLRSNDSSPDGSDDALGGDGSRWWMTLTSGDSFHYFLDIVGVMAAPYLLGIAK